MGEILEFAILKHVICEDCLLWLVKYSNIL